MTPEALPAHFPPWRRKLYVVIFEASTPAGKAFDVLLIVAIILSVVAVALESVSAYRASYPRTLLIAEWAFTILFTIEYVLRLVSAPSAKGYARSFFGIVDLLAILPTYLSALVPGAQALLVVRALRLLRVFRVLKLGHFIQEARVLTRALRASARKILVFLLTVLTLVVIIGAVMYLIEGREHGFTSIPRGVYWAIVTLTTVGYGDISPQTPLGQAFASLVMIMGYGIIAVPTGIVTVELAAAGRAGTRRTCSHCGRGDHDADARYCKECGAALPIPERAAAPAGAPPADRL